MKRVIFSIATTALMLGVGAASFAQNGFAQNIKDRQENQQQRIGEGVENGTLTPGEAARLEHKEGALNKEIRHDRKDGDGLSPKERRQINRQQNRLSRNIYRQKHDGPHK